MFDYQLIEIADDNSFLGYDFSEKNKDKYCLIFFHFKKEDYLKDYQFVKHFEESYNYGVNWINAEKLYEGFQEINKQLGKTLFEQNMDLIVKSQIKEYVLGQLTKTGKYFR